MLGVRNDATLTSAPAVAVIDGWTMVGLVPNTSAPDPVSLVMAAARFALVGVARNVATPVPSPLTPVLMGRPVALVNVPLEGVPSAPPLITNAPAEPTFTPRAVATPVPRPVMLPTAGVQVVWPAAVSRPL